MPFLIRGCPEALKCPILEGFVSFIKKCTSTFSYLLLSKRTLYRYADNFYLKGKSSFLLAVLNVIFRKTWCQYNKTFYFADAPSKK